MSLIASIGWFGTLTYLVNHGYISLVSQLKKPIYYGGNLAAAIALVISSVTVDSYQAVVINSFWALISVLLLAGMDLTKLPASSRLFNGAVLCFIVAIGYRSIQASMLDLTLIGWSAAFVFSAGYLLFCAEKLSAVKYLLWNAYAAIALLPQLWIDQNIPVLVLEVVWAIISLYGAARKYSEVHLID